MERFREFTSLTSTVKDEVRDLPLTKYTCVCGEEASGKTAIGDAIRFAILGRHNRAKNTPSELLKFAVDRSRGVLSRLEGPDGIAEWILPIDPATGAAKKPMPPTFEGRIRSIPPELRALIIPSDPVRELMSDARGPTKLREAILRRWGTSIEKLPRAFALDAEQEVAWKDALSTITRKLQTADGDSPSPDVVLSALSEHFRLAAGAKNRSISPIEKVVAEKRAVIQRAEATGTGAQSELLSQLEARLITASAWERGAADRTHREELQATWSGLKRDHDALVAVLLDLEVMMNTARDEAEPHIQRARTEIESNYVGALVTARARLAFGERLYEQHVAAAKAGATECLLCASPTDVAKHARTFAERVALRRQEIDDLERRQSEARTSLATLERELSDAFSAIRQQRTQPERQLNEVCTQLAQTKGQLIEVERRLEGAPSSYDGPRAEDLRKRIDGIRSLFDARIEVEREGLKLRALKAEYGVLKTLEREAMDMQKSVMSMVVDSASKDVSRFMSGGRVALLDAESMEWTVVGKDGDAHPFGIMCGTEETNLVFAWSAAWTMQSPLRIMLLDDRDTVGLSRKGWVDLFDTCIEMGDRGDFSQVVIVMNRPELVPSSFMKILRGPIVAVPDLII